MFKLRYPPKTITRRRITAERRISFNTSGNINVDGLRNLLNEIVEEGNCLKESKVFVNIYGKTLNIKYRKPEDDSSLNLRQKQYEVELQEFETWRKEHSEEIECALDNKRVDAAEEANKARKEIEHLEKLYSC